PELHAHAPILEVAATLEVALQREHHAGPQERDAGAQAHAVAPVALPHRHDHRAGGTGRTRGNLDLVDEEVVLPGQLEPRRRHGPVLRLAELRQAQAQPVAQAFEAVRLEGLGEPGRAGLDVAVLVHVVVGHPVEQGHPVAQRETAADAHADRVAVVLAARDVAGQGAAFAAVFLPRVHGDAFQVTPAEALAGIDPALQAAGRAVGGAGGGGTVAVAHDRTDRGRIAEAQVHAGQRPGRRDVEGVAVAGAAELGFAGVVLQPGPFMRASGFALAGGAAAVVEDAQALVHDIGHQARGMRGARPESEHRVGIRRQGDPQQRLVGVVHQRRIDAVRHVVGEAGKRAADAACGVHQHDVVVSEQQVGGIGEGHVDVATEAGGTGGLDPAAVGSGEVAVQLQAAVRALGEVAIDCQQAVAADQRACVLDIACEGIAEGAQGGARGHVGIAGEDAVHQLQRAGVDVGTAEADLGIAVDGEQAGAVLVQRLGGQDAAVEAPGQAVADIQHHRIGAVAQVDVADGGGAIHQRDQIVTRAQLHGGGAAIHQPAAGEVGGTRGGGGGNAGVAAGDAALVLDGAVGGAGGGEHAELCTADRAAVDQAVARAPPADARAAADDLDAATVGDPVVGAGHQDAVGAWAGAVDAAGVLDHVVRADDLQAAAHRAAGRDVAAVRNEVVVAAGIQATGTLPADLDRTGVVQLVAAAGDVAAGCRFAGRGDLAEVVRQVVVAAREQSVRARPAGCDAADIGYLVPGAGAVQAMGPGSAGVDPAGIGVADVLPVTAVVDAAGGTAA